MEGKSYDVCTQDMCYFFPVSADCLWKCTTKGSCKWHTSKSYSLRTLESHLPCLGGHRSPSSLTGQSLTILVTMRSLNCSPLTLYRRIRSKKKKRKALEKQIGRKKRSKWQKLLLMFLHHGSSGKNRIQNERKISSLLCQNHGVT